MKRYEYMAIEMPGRLRQLAERLNREQIGREGWLTIKIYVEAPGHVAALLMREIEAPAQSPEQLLGMAAQPGLSAGADHQCDAHTEDALQNLDAAMFSGDGFEHVDDAARLRYFMARWTRELDRRALRLDDCVHTAHTD